MKTIRNYQKLEKTLKNTKNIRHVKNIKNFMKDIKNMAPLLFGVSSVWHVSYSALRRFCGDEPLLFVTFDVC